MTAGENPSTVLLTSAFVNQTSFDNHVSSLLQLPSLSWLSLPSLRSQPKAGLPRRIYTEAHTTQGQGYDGEVRKAFHGRVAVGRCWW